MLFLAFVQMLKAIMDGDLDANVAQVSVPPGLRSTGWSVRLQIIIHNQRAETVQFWWVDYSGKNQPKFLLCACNYGATIHTILPTLNPPIHTV